MSEANERFFTYHEIGDAHSQWGWGRPGGTNIADFIKSLDNDKLLMCTMAAMVNHLGDIAGRLDLLESTTRQIEAACRQASARPAQPEDVPTAIADAMLATFRVLDQACRLLMAMDHDLPLAEADKSGLGIRARKTLWKLAQRGIASLSEINREDAMGCTNCGAATWAEIERWRDLALAGGGGLP